MIHLKYRTFNPAEGEPGIPPQLRAPSGNPIKLLQAVGPMTSEWMEVLEDSGVVFLSFLQDFTFLVYMEEDLIDIVRSLPEVAWIGDFHPAYKIQKGLLEGEGPLAVNVVIFPQLEALLWSEPLMQVVLNLGGRVLFHDEVCSVVTAELYREDIVLLASRPDVHWMDRYDPPVALMNLIRSFTGATTCHNNGFQGNGVVGEVKDNGCDLDHPDFGTLIATDGSPGLESHGTCTYGIVFSDGTNSATAKGMMPNGGGVFCDWDVSRGTSIQRLKNNWGGVFQSNSWSQGWLDGDYTSYSYSDDSAINSYDVSMFYAAGNSDMGVGSETITQDSAAKNVVCMGAVFHQNTSTLSDDQWENHGWGATPSQGPAADGRIKPDLCGPFDSIYCTDVVGSGGYSSGDYYSSFGGTSGATPVAAGAAGLVYDMYIDNHFGNNPTGAKPRVATVKAMLIANAYQYSLSKATRYQQGWGMVDVGKVFNAGINQFIVNGGNPLATGNQRTYAVERKDASTPMKISLVWSDKHGETSSTKALINDLDLKVTAPDSTVYRGNVGLVNNLYSTSGGSFDRANNVENVFIQSPLGGSYTIEVIAYNVAQDNDPGAGVKQDFSLVASQVSTELIVADFSGSPRTIYEGESVTFTDLSSGDVTSWYWTFGDTEFSEEQNPVHVYNNEGDYTVSLTVSGPAGSDDEVKPNYITVLPLLPPEITSVDPTSGPNAGGTLVTVSGSNFMSLSTVDFGSSSATEVTVVDSSMITCRTPAYSGEGWVDVTVTTPLGSDTLPSAFYYYDTSEPQVDSVDPDSGPTSGGTLVTVSGNHFTTSEDTYVAFGIFVASDVNVIDPTTLTCITPGHTAGPVDVSVITSNGMGTLPEGFTYVDSPVVSEVSPSYGHVLGGYKVTITGANFSTSGDTTVTFGGEVAGGVNVLDSDTLTCNTPVHAEGSVTVAVTNSYGYGEKVDGFTYQERPVLYFLGGTPVPGEFVAFRCVVPDRPNQGVILLANNNLGYTWFGNPYNFGIDMELDGIRVLYNSVTNSNRAKLNSQGLLTLILKYPSLGGPTDRFQLVVGTLSPPDLESSNYLDF